MKNNTHSILAIVLAVILVLGCMTGCGTSSTGASAASAASAETPAGGILCISVNPEIAVFYDAAGNVIAVESRNDDGAALLLDYTGFEGKACREVVTELVTAIGEAGYFVEEVEGQPRQITIEIEAGSTLPHVDFLSEVAADVQACVNSNNWHSALSIEGESVYGISDYVDTDYGPDNDGVTDFGTTDYGATDYAENDTDYGPNNDGITDYDDTDYGPNNDGVTDYDDSDYGYTIPVTPSTPPVSSGSSDYGDSGYAAPSTPVPTPVPTVPPVSSGSSDYGNSGYSDYNTSDYGNSGYSDYD